MTAPTRYQAAPTSSNRTFMELKSRCFALLIDAPAVLIVPLWNWNPKKTTLSNGVVLVLIVPLWNWNSVWSSLTSLIWCSNRTFMELKSSTTEDYPCHLIVLIVPLWNWNSVSTSRLWRMNCSNRTFMELKYGKVKVNGEEYTKF